MFSDMSDLPETWLSPTTLFLFLNIMVDKSWVLAGDYNIIANVEESFDPHSCRQFAGDIFDFHDCTFT
ncbi:hypothetical protein EPI10_030081 [Gossypium australe]|uniref:DUF4408 domain-containing protein n=1 Tax=Gossypium australe TaxID=47621 RepID=A0A5B6WXB5_9ROSI|nr:hypothetical protein EPI10_030081 [Gossypium australe]